METRSSIRETIARNFLPQRRSIDPFDDHYRCGCCASHPFYANVSTIDLHLPRETNLSLYVIRASRRRAFV